MNDITMKVGGKRLWLGSRRLPAVVGLLVFGLVLITGIETADAKVARLHVHVPASVKDGATWTIRARGYAGTYDTVAFHAFFGTGCPPTQAAFVGGQPVSVTPNQPFHLSSQFIASNPGHHQACVYLFTRLARTVRSFSEKPATGCASLNPPAPRAR